MSQSQEITALRAQNQALSKKLEAERQKSNNLETAFKRLLFGTEVLMDVLGPIIGHFKGMAKKKGLAGAGALPMVINQVMKMLSAESAEKIVLAAEKDINPMITQYSAYYKQKEAKEEENVTG